MQTNIVFDIETETLPEQEIAHLAPEFTAPKNYVDPKKIQASIDEQRSKWLADGALSAVTGRVLCIGQLMGDEFYGRTAAEHEKEALEIWWQDCQGFLTAGNRLIGFCCRTFDIPFLIRRSYRHQVTVPGCIWEGRYLSGQIVDIADIWSCGGRDPRDRISLDTLSKFLGIGAKNGDGKDFGLLWRTDRTKALEYLKNDLQLTKAAYERMQVNR